MSGIGVSKQIFVILVVISCVHTAPTVPPSSGQPNGRLEVTDVAELTYKNAGERSGLLQQILTLWIKALGSVTIDGLAIAFVKEIPSGRGTNLVTYSVTGQLSGRQTTSTNWKQLLNTVHKSIETSQITGLKLPTDSRPIVSGRLVGRLTLTDVLDLTYKDTAERDGLLQKILSLWADALGSANNGDLKIGFVKEEPSGHDSHFVTYNVTGTTGKLTIGPQQLGDNVHKLIEAGRVGGVRLATKTISLTLGAVPQSMIRTREIGQLNVTDHADIIYSTTAQRDAMLQKILNLWSSSLGSANMNALNITFISAMESCEGGHVVAYRIAGKIGKIPMTGRQLLNSIHKSIEGGAVAGVYPATGKRCSDDA
ncbi:hypothetical protein BV898_12271 [Hypsibius exemplaris]|uniref:SEA domain-containing protein n=1 Tax=Hypsibius exemplaris TaxID=2072580 RepID=A0A1W0WE79_HYPEX|nr:hypothetical protein BV898_12271 [Hypsibius exemplaris]